VRPGAFGYLFRAGETADGLVRQLAESGWRGQIVGPHGSGKSTMVASLLPAFERAGRRACVFALHDGQRKMPRAWMAQARALQARLIVVDGYEQLNWLSRTVLKRRCARAGWGLLVTAHADVNLPTLARIEPDVAIAQAVVARLLPPGEAMDREMVAESFAAANGNMREMLFALYDRYERAKAGIRC
jgi:hypothetical protein